MDDCANCSRANNAPSRAVRHVDPFEAKIRASAQEIEAGLLERDVVIRRQSVDADTLRRPQQACGERITDKPRYT